MNKKYLIIVICGLVILCCIGVGVAVMLSDSGNKEVTYTLPTAMSMQETLVQEAVLSNTEVPTAEILPPELPTQAPPPKPTTYNVGDLVKTNDHVITLNSTRVENGVLFLNFTVENIGNEEINISSLLNFSARLDDGTSLEQEIFDCGTSLDGKVLVGDKLRGDICYAGANSFPIKVYYEADWLGSGAVVWQINN